MQRVLELKKFVKFEPAGQDQYLFDMQGVPSIKLLTGYEAFDEAARDLEAASPSSALVYNKVLNLEIPDKPADWKNSNVIKEIIRIKNAELQESVNFSFQYDLTSTNPQISLLMMLIDDTKFKGQRRTNLLNGEFKSIGISHVRVKAKNCVYLTFAK